MRMGVSGHDRQCWWLLLVDSSMLDGTKIRRSAGRNMRCETQTGKGVRFRTMVYDTRAQEGAAG